MNHEANNANSKAISSRSCSGFFMHCICPNGDFMNADEWLNECLLVEGGKHVTRRDINNFSIPRERLIKDLFPEIQRTVVIEIPNPIPGETVERYRARVIRAAKRSGGTVVAAK